MATTNTLNLRLISRAFSEPMMLFAPAAHHVERVAAMVMVGASDDNTAKYEAAARAERWGFRPVEDARSRIKAMEDDGYAVRREKAPPPAYTMVGSKRNIAAVDISGVLDRTESDVTDSRGNAFGTAYDTIASNLNKAVADPNVAGIMLVMNSPGGAALPCAECAAAVADAATKKPVCSYTLDMNCSAALYLSSQGSKGGLMVGPSSLIGSIGTTQFHYDESAALAKWGVKVTQFSSAEGKTLGASHRPLEAADRADLQKGVDVLGAQFEQAVMSGRGVTQAQVDAWKKESALIGTQAAAEGLADSVQINLPAAIAAMEEKFLGGKPAQTKKTTNPGMHAAARADSGKSSHAARSSRMTIEELMAAEGGEALISKIKADAEAKGKMLAAPKPASIAELREAFPGDSDFVLNCASAGMSMDQAKAHRSTVLEAKLAAAAEEKGKLEAQLSDRHAAIGKLAAAGVRPGAAPVNFGTGAAAAPANGGADADFDDLVNAEIEARRQRNATLPADRTPEKVLRSTVVWDVRKKHPKAWAAYRKNMEAGVAPAGAVRAGLGMGVEA